MELGMPHSQNSGCNFKDKLWPLLTGACSLLTFIFWEKETWKLLLQVKNYTHIYHNTICNSKTMETAQMLNPNEWIKKIWYIYNGVLFSSEKEQNYVICR
jgi:hypothetical protein